MISKFSFLVRESFLRVAAIDDVYQKYYSTIPREIFDELVAADPTAALEAPRKPKKMGAYGQWILKMYSRGSLPLEDTEKLYPLLQDMQRLAPVLKKEGVSFDILKFKTPVELFTFYHEHRKKLPPDPEALDEEDFPDILLEEKYYLDSGEAEKVYEDSDIVIFVPKTLVASKFYGYGSDWCTLYPDNFQRYSSEGSLYIIVFKNREGFENRWQFHFESGQFMDFSDDDLVEDGHVISFFRKNPDVNNFFKTRYFPTDVDKIIPTGGVIPAKIVNPKDLVEYSRQSKTDVGWLFGVISGEEYLESDTGNSFQEITKWTPLSDTNINLIQEHLEANYSEEIEGQGLSLSSYEEILECVSYLDAQDIVDAVRLADSDATSDSIIAALLRNIRQMFTDHFGIDFSEWFPDEGIIQIEREYIEEYWFAFYMHTQTNMISSAFDDISDILIAVSGKVPAGEAEDLYRRAENEGYTQKAFNYLLEGRLKDI